MIKHYYTDTTEVNFSKLENRILGINDPQLGNYNKVSQMINSLDKPTLIMATGGSKAVANFLQLILERQMGIICDVIEPRDYFYKANRNMFSNLVVISASGNTNGVNEALSDFKGNKFLITEKVKEGNFEVVTWGNELYDREKSFISLSTSLGPMALMLDSTILPNKKTTIEEVKRVNERIKELLKKSREKVTSVDVSFKNTSLVHIMSGYETRTSSSVLESNLTETGTLVGIIHDKGAFCHGRSNLIFQNPKSKVIYLTHGLKDLDNVLIGTIDSEYSNVSVFDTFDLDESIFWKEFYLTLQMYYLSRKISDDKGTDLTMPDYNTNVIKKLYKYRGEM